MYRPVLLIHKKKILDAKGRGRYYKQTPGTIPCEFATEKQLCRFIYTNFGPGHYMILAFVKGRRGFWIFWKGDIDDNGFVFEQKNRSNTREINQLKKDFEETNDEEERKIILQDIELEKEVNSYSRYGFYPYMRSSGVRGNFVGWQDPELPRINNQENNSGW